MTLRRLVSLAAATILATSGLISALVVVSPDGSPSTSCGSGGSAAATPTSGSASTTAPLAPTALVGLRMLDATHGWATLAVWPQGAASALVLNEAVMVTGDGGAHWRSVSPPASDRYLFGASLIGTSDAAHAWGERPTSQQLPSSVYQTSDCGVTWTRLTLPVTQGSVTFLDPYRGFLMGEYEQAASDGEVEESVAFWETSDAGAEWSPVTRVPPLTGPGPIALPEGCLALGTGWSTLSTGWIVGACLVSNPQPDMGYAALLVTHDGGRTWQSQTLPIPPSVTLSFLEPPTFTTPDDGEMVGLATTSGTPCVYATKDGGATWSPQCGALPTPENSVPGAVITPDGTVVTLLQDGTIAESTDGGRSWQTPGPSHPELEVAGSHVDLDFVDAEHGFISLPSGALYATSDGGRTLHLVYQSPAGPLDVSAPPSAGPSAPLIEQASPGSSFSITFTPASPQGTALSP